jgi:hypothetical protein
VSRSAVAGDVIRGRNGKAEIHDLGDYVRDKENESKVPPIFNAQDTSNEDSANYKRYLAPTARDQGTAESTMAKRNRPRCTNHR